VSEHFARLVGAGLIGIGPALAAVYFALRRFDRPHYDHTLFDDRRVFFAIAAGFILGGISLVASVFLRPAGAIDALVALLVLAAFEEGFKLVYLNRHGYRGRFDTTFVGVALGGGMAAVSAFGEAYRVGPALLDAGVLLLFLGFSVSFAALHTSTGALLGFGCAFGQTFPRMARVLVVRAGFALVLLPFVVAGRPDAFAVASLGGACAFALLFYWFNVRHLLPQAVPEDVRRQRRKVRRRAVVR
jgi:hypothetical protein